MLRHPPRLATALLKRFGPKNEALAGDLREAYVAGRSRSWYWRQVLTAFAVEVGRDSYARMGVAMGTVLGAVMLVSTADSITDPVRGWLLYRVIQPAAWAHPTIAAHGLMVLWFTDVAPFASTALFGGWTVGRLNGTRRGLVVLFSSVVFLGLLWRWSIVVVRTVFVAQRHLPLPYLLLFVAGQIVMPPVMALVGGMRSESTSKAEGLAR